MVCKRCTCTPNFRMAQHFYDLFPSTNRHLKCAVMPENSRERRGKPSDSPKNCCPPLKLYKYIQRRISACKMAGWDLYVATDTRPRSEISSCTFLKSPISLHAFEVCCCMVPFPLMLAETFIFWGGDRSVLERIYMRPLSLPPLPWNFRHSDLDIPDGT